MPETKLSPPESAASPMGGRTLPPTLKHQMESALGRDLSHVRVFEDHRPTHLGAQAYSVGSDVIFAPGQYDPTSPEGKRLIAHELTHVVQQRHGSTEVVQGMVQVQAPVNKE